MASERKSTDAFEAALKRELQNALPANAADCPAPDILAAYYDRALSRSERDRVDSHLTSCAPCQSMMASIARADADLSAPQPEPTEGLFWIARLLAPVAVIGVVIAIAIGVRTREQRPPDVIALASPAVSLKSELQDRAAAPPAEIAPQPQPAPQVSSAPPGEGDMRHAERLANHHKKSMEKSAPPAGANSNSIQAGSISDAVPPQSAPAAVASSPSSDRATRMGAPIAEGVGDLAKVEQSPSHERAEVYEPSMAANSASLEAAVPGAQKQTAQALEKPAMLAPSAAAGSALSGAVAMMAKAPPPNQISSPDGSVLWRFGTGGAIFRSGNSSEWLTLRAGVTTDLLAASAPSNDVCWVAGKSGTIVRTLDGGNRWQLVKPPARENFTAISATDSNNATVTTTNGLRFATHDGGVTWSSP